MVEKVLQLKCSCNEYPWGKKGSDSLAAQLCSKTPGTDFNIDENTPYSEMWMGTYPELPSYVLETGEDLQDVLDNNAAELIGQTVPKRFNHNKIPYLPKVLSIAKALPLQLHPNKDMAAKLHSRDPSQFTDPNHKPEIALALSDFEAFCGFKPLKEIAALLDLEPLQQFLPTVKKPNFDDQVLKHVVKAMLSASDETIKSVNDALLKLPRESFGSNTHIPDLIPRLSSQYDKTDNGTVVALITMNYLQLKKGDSIYIPADGIHAYLSGDIIECMARSNNVLNTGFCPRAERNSVEQFCSVLTFMPHSPKECMLQPQKFERSRDGKTKVYAPPLAEFSTLMTEVEKGGIEGIGAIEGPSMFIVREGKGLLRATGKEYQLSDGYIFFVGQGVDMEFEASEEALEIYTFIVE
ncbi:mannose-6-phosphate isomeras-like protein [Lophiotrema nucula]|uniref:Mannose-6-phosphate isomerase n=1 Tax=Lophiotrema nucula TaxID=690887 RepID=A0A6A5YJG7_9PLEO|nr:mannose-6-phosphate isomeras-like protein [Lophiotrema nucula]